MVDNCVTCVHEHVNWGDNIHCKKCNEKNKIQDVINKLKQLENNAYGYHYDDKVIGMDVSDFEKLMAFCYHYFEKELKKCDN